MASRRDQDPPTFSKPLSPGINFMREGGEDNFFPLGKEDIQICGFFLHSTIH
jgi:hypothetical protein